MSEDKQTDAKKARANSDHFPTPYELCLATVQELTLRVIDRRIDNIIDPGAGDTGNWGTAARTRWPLAINNGRRAARRAQAASVRLLVQWELSHLGEDC
jgi:hypothetical protein